MFLARCNQIKERSYVRAEVPEVGDVLSPLLVIPCRRVGMVRGGGVVVRFCVCGLVGREV